MFFCWRGRIIRSTLVTGFFTGAAACGAAAEGWPICALPEPGMAQTKTANRNAADMRFIGYLLNNLIRLRYLAAVSGTPAMTWKRDPRLQASRTNTIRLPPQSPC